MPSFIETRGSGLFAKIRRLDLQAKISLVLLGVILPTFLIVTVAENKLMQPMLAEQMKQIGIASGTTLATEIVDQKMFQAQNSNDLIEGKLREFLYTSPHIRRIDVFSRVGDTVELQRVASTVEEPPGTAPLTIPWVETTSAEYFVNELDEPGWKIFVPIVRKTKDPKSTRRILGIVHVDVSLKLVAVMVGILWTTTALAAAISMVLLFLVLSYFLRKTISNDRRLRVAEDQNLQLSAQLHETERQLMNTEKLAAMGQLTASFAHEVGTPLNAIGGHLQLLKEEVQATPRLSERFEIVEGQLNKIEKIVKGFLQSTAKPVSQKQLVDPMHVIEQTLRIVRPRTETLDVEVRRDFNRSMGPIRIVPLDLEQMLLNLVNNSLDSMKYKAERNPKDQKILELSTRVTEIAGREWAVIAVFDTGEGIGKADLAKVLKPFYTTKRPGEGTGLGLTICQELAHKYGGVLEVDSKQAQWTRVTIRLPYQ